MAQERFPQITPERRCPNCGTRVAQDAESCFMCGYNLRIQPKRPQRISWVDALLVVAVLVVLGFWWQIGSQPFQAEEASTGVAILPGQIPVLTPTEPSMATPIPTASPTPIPPEDVLVTHQVRAGQSLLLIASDYGVSVEQIRAANNLRDDLIRVGDELLIPIKRAVAEARALDPVESTFTYTVQDGDTVISIATLFGANPNDILAQNGLVASDIIRPGQTLVIPVRNVPEQVLESRPEAPDSPPADQAIGGSDDENRIYLAPSLTGPPDSSTIARDEPVLLRWVSVDVLAHNEWYVIQIYSTADAAGNPGANENFPTLWTKATSYRLGTEFAPPPDQSVTYTWRLSVIRVRTTADGQHALEPTSPPSSPRIFTWQ